MRRAALTLLCLAPFAACSDPPSPFDSDASVVVGDATSLDATMMMPGRDAIAIDADGGPGDGAPGLDAGADGAIADAADAAPGAELPRTDGATPGRDAEPTDAGPPPECARPATMTLTASAAVAQAVALDGTIVEVLATADSGPPTCSRRACTEADPCCNDCEAEIRLDGVLPMTAGACVARVGCSGDECTLVCTPALLGFPQTFRGTLRSGPARLEIHQVGP